MGRKFLFRMILSLLFVAMGVTASFAQTSLYVSSDYNSSTEGYGTTKFSNYAGAYAYATANAKTTATIVIEKTNTLSGNTFDNNHKNYSKLAVVIKDGATMGNALSKWDMTYPVTVEPGGTLTCARPASASVSNIHIKNKLIVGAKGATKKAVVDFLSDSYQDCDISIRYNGSIEVYNADFYVQDLDAQGKLTIEDSKVEVDGAFASATSTFYPTTLTNSTITINGNQISGGLSDFSGGTSNQLGNVKINNSTLTIKEGTTKVAANVTATNSTIAVNDLTVNTGKTLNLNEGSTLEAENITTAGTGSVKIDGVQVPVVDGAIVVPVADFAALKAAVEAGKNVQFTADITTSAAITTSGVTSVVDLNGKTLTIGAGDNQFNDESNITIKNGDINITGVTVGGNAIFRLDEYEKTLVTTMTLENVNLVGNGYSSAYGIFYIGSSSVLNVIGGEWNLKNDTYTDGGVFKADASAATLNIEGTKITAHNVRRFVTYAATEINNATIALSGDADEVDAEMEHGFNRSPLAISNSTITMTDMVGRGITAEKGAVTIANSSVTMTNVQEATIDVRGNQTVTIDNTSTVSLDKAPTVASGSAINGTVQLPPMGNDFTGYTRGDAIWGEVWGNASESFVIKVLDANGNVMGTTSLNNVGGIINGNVNVTWSLKLDAASNTDEYWTMEWTTAPTIDNMPAKVELWVDGVKVSGGNVVLNGPDEIAKIYAAVTDASGKILVYHTDIQEAIKAAAAVTSVAKTATAGTVEFLSDVTVDKWIMFAEKMSIGDGSLITLNINGVTIDGNNNTLTVKSIESASNGGYLFYDAQNLTVKDLTINIADGLVGGIGLQSGTISNVTFNGGQYAVLPGKNGVTVSGCTFNDTKGYAVYYEDARPGIVVDGNTFNTAEGKYAITMRSDEQFTNNTITKGRVNLANSAASTVSGNDFGTERFKVYNGATATITGNTINNLVFNDNSVVNSTFGENTLSEDAQAVLDAVSFPVAQIGDVKYATLKEAIAEVEEGQTIEFLAGTIEEGTIKLPATLKNVTFKGAADNTSILKDMTIMASDGNSFSYIGLTFDGIQFDNSRIVFTGWRNGEETIEDLTITNCIVKNLYDDTNMAFLHINKGASEPVKNLTFTNNVLDGVTGGSKSGIYSVNTGKVIIKGNTFNNIVFRPALVQLSDCDGIVDNVEISNNEISNTTRLQVYGTEVDNGDGTYTPTGTDELAVKINNNIFKNISGYYICTWGINGDYDISKNYYDSDNLSEKIYWNNEKPSTVSGLYELGVYPVYTELNADGTINTESEYTPNIPFAQIGETGYPSLEAAAAAAQAGDEILLLANVTLSEELTTTADITLNGNGKQINGTINAGGALTIKGQTKVTKFGAGSGNTITIGAGACLEMNGTDRMVIGHGCTFNITGTITDAKTANVADLTPSLIMPGASFTGAGVTFNVTNAYISAPSSYCSSSKSASGTFDFNITNSIWDSAGKLAFEAQSTAAKVDFALVNSVLTTGSHLVFATASGEEGVVIDNSLVNQGTSRQIENRGTMTIKNGAVVNGAVATSSNAINPGTIIVENATYAVTGEFSGAAVGTGNLIIKKGANVSVGSIKAGANVTVDAEGMTAGDEINFTADLSQFTGTLYVINNDKLEAKIVDGKIVLATKPVAKIGEQGYATLEDAFKAATSGCTIDILSDVTVDYNWDARYTGGKFTVPVTINGNDKTIKFTASVNDNNYQAPFRFEKEATVNNLTVDMSEVTDVRFRAISSKGNLTVDDCKFIGKDETLNCRAVIFGEGAGANVGNLAIAITNSEFINWKRGITDNENAQDVKTVTITGNTLTDAGVVVSAKETVTFTGNTVSGAYVNIKSYTAGNKLAVTATGNTLEANTENAYNVIDAGGVVNAEGFKVVAKGNDFTGYTRGDAIWGEVWGNAKESFVIKVLDANGNVMGTTSLNNIGGIIDGDVNVTWNIKLDAASNTDEYWTMAWTTAPTIDNMPAKVELWVDGVKVSGGNVVLNGPDEIAKIYAAVTDASGKILGYHTDIQEAIKAAAAVTSVARTATAGTVEVLSDVTVDKWIMFAEKMSIGDGSLITLNINGVTIDGNNNTLTVKSIESAGNGGYLFYDAQNLTVKDLTINIADGLVGGIGLQSGTISNVTFNGGQYGVLPGKNGVTVSGCTFNDTKGYAVYYEDARPDIVVTGNTFNTADGKYAITMRSNEQFTNNTITKGRVNLANSAASTVSGNDFGTERFKVYNGATATISNNKINNLVFSETNAPAASTFAADNTLSAEAQAAIDALPVMAGDGTEGKPYTIGNLAQLKAFRDDVNAGNKYQGKFVKLTADIDLNNEEWTPIATFNGVFDGNDKTISNLVVNGEGKSNQGFFGQTNNGEIKNLTINNAKVTGRLNVGVVAGTPYTSKYTNIKVTGHVEVNGMAYVGGVGGKNAYANWTDITVSVDETSYVNAYSVENGTAYRTYVGGVIGFNGEGGHTFKKISSNIKVIGSTKDVGGIFGILHYGNNAENVTFTGAVEAPADAKEVGGIAGVWHNEKGQTVTITNATSEGTVKVGDVTTTGSIVGGAYNADNKYEANSGSLIIDGKEAWLPCKVATKAELNAALAVAKEGDIIVMDADIDYGADQLAIAKAITLDLGGKTLTTRNAHGGMSIKNNPTIKNGNIVHASNTAAIKVWNATAFEDLVIDVQGKGDANKTIGGIVLQSGTTTRVGSIKNVTIKGAALTNGIETYNCGDATENVISSMENVNIDAVGTAMLISAPCGTATNCTFDGGVNGIEIWIKGNYSASLELVDCDVVGGVFAHDEFNSNPEIVNNGTLNLTADEATTGAGVDDVTLTLARAENVEGVLEDVMEQAKAKVNNTYYQTLSEAVAAAETGSTITLLNGEHELPLFANKELTFVGESKEGVIVNDAPTAVTQGWNGSTFHFENLTAKGATANYHGLANGVKAVTYKNCNINGLRFLYATEGVSFEGCAFNANGVEHSFWTYGASNVTVKNSTFTYTDRAVNCYSENGANHEADITFEGCSFTYAGTNDTPEGAVEINSGSAKSFDIAFTGCTAPEKGAMWFNSQWDNKNGENTVVKVDDVIVWQVVKVAKIGDVEYTTLEAAFAAATEGQTITLLADVTLAGGYEDATEGLRIEKEITLNGNGYTINCGNFQKGIRIYNPSNVSDFNVNFNNVEVVNNVANGRCIDTRSGNINLKVNSSTLIATNGNSQPLTIGGNDPVHRVTLNETTIDAGASGYAVISFVSTNVDIQGVNNSTISGFAAFYLKGDAKTTNLNLGQGVYTGTNNHAIESGVFGTVVLEGDNNVVNLMGTNATVKAIANNTAPQAAFLVRGANNTIKITKESAKIITEGNAYEAMVKADNAATTKFVDMGIERKLVAENEDYQFYSFEEAVRFAGNEGTIKVVNDFELAEAWTVAAGQNITLDLNGKTISQTKECTASYEMICNKGNLTITDSSDAKDGKLSFKDTSAGDPSFGWGSYTVRNVGNLVVENGTIEHLGEQAFAKHCIMAIYQYSGSTTINGGTISTPNYRSARLWKGDMTINGGTFDGQVWVQAVDNTAKLTVNGGTFAPNGNDASAVFVTNSQYDVQFAVTDGTFNGKVGCSDATKLAGAITGGKFTETAKNGTNAALLATGLAFGEADANGYYAVEDDPATHYIATLDELKAFRDAVNSGANYYAGVTVYLAADIDMAGENWVGIGSATADHGFMGNFDGNNFKIKNLTIDNPALDSYGYAYAGFFGVTEGTDKDNQNTIKNLTIENVTISTNGHIAAAAVAYPYYTIIDNVKVCGDIKIQGGDYTAGILAYTRRCVNASYLSVVGNTGSYVKGNTTVGGVISDIQTNGGLVAVYKNFSAEGIAVEGTKSVGAISGIISGQNLDKATVKNVELNSQDGCAGIVAGRLGAASTVTNVSYENVTGAATLIGGGYDSAKAVQAKIGDTYYATLEAALAADGNESVELLATYEVAAGETKTLDLKGKTVTMVYTQKATKNHTMISNSGNLTIESSVEGGKLSYTYAGENIGTTYSVNTVTSNPGSVLTVKSGTIENLTYDNSFIAYAIDGLTNGGAGDVTVNIEGGVITSKRQALRIFANSTTNTGALNISGGDFTGRVIVQNSNSNANKAALNITGGTFNANEYKSDVLYVGGSNSATIDIDATVSGGTFKGEITETHVTGFISGGTFSSDVSVLCAKGFVCNDNGDSTYGVVEKSAVAKIDDVEYKYIQAAITAAGTAETTINVIANTTENITIQEGANITLEFDEDITLNGYFAPFRGNLTIKDGTINNTNSGASAIEINAGELNLNNVNIASARHAVRIDGDVTATINGGEYTLTATSGTRHAVNVSGGAEVTIIAGTFVGPKGTTMDSGSAVCVQAGAKVTIEGGDFSGGKNATLGVTGTMTVTGGTFDQDPSAYLAQGYITKYNETTSRYEVFKGVAMIEDEYFASIQDAIDAAENNDVIKVLNYIYLSDDKELNTLGGKYNTYFKVEDKTVTIDLNGKIIYVEYSNPNMLVGVFSTENNGHLTLMDSSNGTGSVDVVTKGNGVVYSLIANYESGCSITINGGTYKLDKASDSHIYSGCGCTNEGTQGVTVNGGVFYLGNVATGSNGSPWIFNVKGQNNGHVKVFGGTYNYNVFNQHWIFEAQTSKEYAIRYDGDETWTVVPAVAWVNNRIQSGSKYYTYELGYTTLAEAIAAAEDCNEPNFTETVTLLQDITLENTITVNAGKDVILDLNGKTISGVCNSGQGHMFMVQNTADLTIKDSSENEEGKIIYSRGTSNTGWVIDLEGDLILESGTIELTGDSWSIGYAVDVRPNSWGSEYTEATTFTMSGGKLVSSDAAVRVASSSADNHENVSANFIMNGGEIEAAWDGIFVQQSNAAYDILNVRINGGNIKSALSPLRLYGPAATSVLNNVENPITLNITDGTFDYTGNDLGNEKWLVRGVIMVSGGATFEQMLEYTDFEITGGTFEGDVNAYCAEGFAATNNDNGTWTVMPAQKQSLVKGWNWYSTYLDIETADLTGALGSNGDQIKNQDGGKTFYVSQRKVWEGSLTLEHDKMYMINVLEACSLQLAADVVDATSYDINLRKGWSWIGYPSNQEIDINTALANFEEPNEGDRIKSQYNGYAEYRWGKWRGTLKTLVPGIGYMYNNKTETVKSFRYNFTPETTSRGAVEANVTAENNYWTPDATKYPFNMTMTAVVDGLADANYEVAAFVNGEVRGSARPIYIEEIDAYVLFLTIHGEDVEEMSFRLYDIDNDTEYDLSDRINYSNNAEVGSLDNPYTFSRGTTGIGEASMSEVNIYPNPTTTGTEINLEATCDKVEVFNALGVKVAEYQNVDTIDALETAGIYVIRITNNGNVQNCRLVVK